MRTESQSEGRNSSHRYLSVLDSIKVLRDLIKTTKRTALTRLIQLTFSSDDYPECKGSALSGRLKLMYCKGYRSEGEGLHSLQVRRGERDVSPTDCLVRRRRCSKRSGKGLVNVVRVGLTSLTFRHVTDLHSLPYVRLCLLEISGGGTEFGVGADKMRNCSVRQRPQPLQLDYWQRSQNLNQNKFLLKQPFPGLEDDLCSDSGHTTTTIPDTYMKHVPVRTHLILLSCPTRTHARPPVHSHPLRDPSTP